MIPTPPEPEPKTSRRRIAAAVDSLTARMLLASSILALLLAGGFAVLAFAVRDLSAAAEREARAKEVVAQTVVVQKLVFDLEAGVRGFVITRERQFLLDWQKAQNEMRLALADFRRDAGDLRRREMAARLTDLVTRYQVEYAEPLIEIARRNPGAARSITAVSEGRMRTEEIRGLLDGVLADELIRAAESAASAREERRRALALGFTGIAAAVLLILLLGLYLTRSIARPVSQVATEARRIARGDLTVELDERGPGEVGTLKRAFRAMAADLEERQRALEDHNRRLAESERLKSELISIVSHEIRTPLSSILGFASLLQQRDVEEADRDRFLEIIGTEARRLATLLDDFLDVQLLEDGPLELSFAAVDVSALLRTQGVLFSAESTRHALNVHLPDGPLVVEGDTGRLAQVFANLISNAIKYSPQGGAVDVFGEEDDGVVRIRVRDQGFGIPPEVGDQIFTKFFRGSAAAHGIPGSGLGLALARSIIEAHGGSIGFESVPGQGTTFTVALPKEARTAQAAESGERRQSDV
ncbi:MAG: CHASE3 domain-containing protein [Thermoleophilia bacterium]|nr:CHASE3 domain-containing protein [Thermoleophilia bacterium]